MQQEAAGQGAGLDGNGEASAADPGTRKTARKKPAPSKNEGEISKVLQSVYQRTVSEDIPAEMLDLLNKLD
jgi:hypothetical protein